MTPLERAARALFEYEPGPYGDCVEWAIEQDFGWRDQVDAVKLVLAAIREPSYPMEAAAFAHMVCFRGGSGMSDVGQLSVEIQGEPGAKTVWQAMIDAALEEE